MTSTSDGTAAEAKALEIASEMVLSTYWEEKTLGLLTGPRWEGVDMNNEAAITARLEALADQIRALKNRLLQ